MQEQKGWQYKVPVFAAAIGTTMPRTRASPTATTQATSTAIATTITAVGALAFPRLSRGLGLGREKKL